MKALITDGRGGLSLAERPLPATGPYDCLVRTRHCLFCSSTDRHIVEGTYEFGLNYPVLLGHESLGQVIQCGGKVRNFRNGDWVSRAYAQYPDEQIGEYGSGWGGFAEFTKVRDWRAESEDGGMEPPAFFRYMQKLPPDLTPERAELIVCQKEIYSSVCKLGDPSERSFLISGAGVAALLFAVFLKMKGAVRVAVTARREEALATARQLTPVDETYLLGGAEPPRERFGELIETTGSLDLLGRLAADWLHPGGTIHGYAIYPDKNSSNFTAHLPGNPCFERIDPDEASAHGAVCELLLRNEITATGWIVERYPLAEFNKAWASVLAKKGPKILVEL